MYNDRQISRQKAFCDKVFSLTQNLTRLSLCKNTLRKVAKIPSTARVGFMAPMFPVNGKVGTAISTTCKSFSSKLAHVHFVQYRVEYTARHYYTIGLKGQCHENFEPEIFLPTSFYQYFRRWEEQKILQYA